MNDELDLSDFDLPPGTTPQVASTAGGLRRQRSLEETQAWLLPKLRRVPITRLADIAPLDALGLQVCIAVTPFALDVKTHGSRGLSKLEARVGAIMEAIERVSAESCHRPPKRRGSYVDLGAAAELLVVDPVDLGLPFETEYAPTRELGWVLGFDLIGRTKIWVPEDFVVAVARDGVSRGVETNGLASGNTLLEAALHALYEVIERDATSLHIFSDTFCKPEDTNASPVRMLDLSTLPEPAKVWVAKAESEGLSVGIRDITSDLGIATFEARMIDPAVPVDGQYEELYFKGYGTCLDPQRAVMSAMMEALQSRIGFTQGSRDVYEGLEPREANSSRKMRELLCDQPEEWFPFPAAPTSLPKDAAEELWQVVSRLSERGFQRCVVADLTRPDLDVPVVRVLVPGMAWPYAESLKRPGIRLLQRLY
ncbi:MAG: YcaO-like family protein [Deltaproteobacteria bacterium]|nr:YcaO-like family protein [Deltaproteobacteria bacterium]